MSCLLSEQSYTFIEEVPPQKEDSLLQEGPDEDEFKLKLDLNMSEKFEEQEQDPLESLIVIHQDIMSDS